MFNITCMAGGNSSSLRSDTVSSLWKIQCQSQIPAIIFVSQFSKLKDMTIMHTTHTYTVQMTYLPITVYTASTAPW